jgi:histidine triad (HIT) family protein
MSGSAACIFCRIVAGEMSAKVVAQGDTWLAFRDVNPQAPTHILIVTRQHIASLTELVAEDATAMGDIVLAAARIAESEGAAGAGYRVVVNAGRDGGQSVDHVHFHVLAGRRLGWPPG